MRLAALKKRVAQTPAEVVVKMEQKLLEFARIRQSNNREWFSELCFCLLTSNAKSSTACAIQAELGYDGFMHKSESQLVKTILKNKHRFHNTKAARIVEARKHSNVYDILNPIAETNMVEARKWLVDNVKGIGYKEASHFLRNVGYDNIAILDRHVLALMLEFGWIAEIKPLTPKSYKQHEDIFLAACNKIQISAAKLDYYFWYWKAGDVLK